jgi:hypothetical protein
MIFKFFSWIVYIKYFQIGGKDSVGFLITKRSVTFLISPLLYLRNNLDELIIHNPIVIIYMNVDESKWFFLKSNTGFINLQVKHSSSSSFVLTSRKNFSVVVRTHVLLFVNQCNSMNGINIVCSIRKYGLFTNGKHTTKIMTHKCITQIMLAIILFIIYNTTRKNI